jgi:hypothetical protein
MATTVFWIPAPPRESYITFGIHLVQHSYNSNKWAKLGQPVGVLNVSSINSIQVRIKKRIGM